MTLLSVLHTDGITISSDALVIGSEDVGCFEKIISAATAISELQATWQRRLEESEQEARERGYAAGLEAGRREAAEQVSASANAIQEHFNARYAELRDEALHNALAIVRRIASSLGESQMLAALALDAANALMPADSIVLHVHSSRFNEVRDSVDHQATAAIPRSAETRPALLVQSDDTLDPGECRLETDAGSVLAGLETQLRAIERRAVKQGAHDAG